MRKQIPDYSRYEIETDGRVWDTLVGKYQPTVWNGDFLCTNLIREDGAKVLCKIHRLVAITFVDNPHNANRVVHKDGDRSNNHMENIMWQPKQVKEVVVKEEQTYPYCNQQLTLDAVVDLCGEDKSVIKKRLKAGWSVVECKLGYRNFTGTGVENENHWFPDKKTMKAHLWEEQQKVWEVMRLEKELRKQEREDYKKYGVGVFVNEPIQGIVNRVTTNCYRTWDGMLARCYNPSSQSYLRYGGRGVRVMEDWYIFQNFASWWEGQYREEGWHLDKDILVEGNLMYSADTCVFVPPEINTFFSTLPTQGSRELPSGVQKEGRKYRVSLCVFGEKIQPAFDSAEEASNYYRRSKESHAKQLANMYEGRLDVRVFSKLMNFQFPA